MKKCMCVLTLLFACAVLLAVSPADSLKVKKDLELDGWLYGDVMRGSVSSYDMLRMEAGLSTTVMKKMRISIYLLTFAERVPMFDDPKYEFKGYGIQVGPEFTKKNITFAPTIGLEKGTMSIGVGDYTPSFFGNQYENYVKENITYVPVALNLHYRFWSVAAISTKAFVASHPKYQVKGVSLGLCIGNF